MIIGIAILKAQAPSVPFPNCGILALMIVITEVQFALRGSRDSSFSLTTSPKISIFGFCDPSAVRNPALCFRPPKWTLITPDIKSDFRIVACGHISSFNYRGEHYLRPEITYCFVMVKGNMKLISTNALMVLFNKPNERYYEGLISRDNVREPKSRKRLGVLVHLNY